MVMKKTVGEKIRSFRQQKKLTQEQLALGAEINPVFLGHLERNLKSPTITTLEKITRALGITMSELFLDVPNMTVKSRLDKQAFSILTIS